MFPVILQVVNIRRINRYCIQPNKLTVCWRNNCVLKECQGICSDQRTIKFVSLDNKVFV